MLPQVFWVSLSALVSALVAFVLQREKSFLSLKQVKSIYYFLSLFTLIIGVIFLIDFCDYAFRGKHFIDFTGGSSNPEGKPPELADVIALVGISFAVFAAFDALLFGRKDIEEKGDLVIEAVANLLKEQGARLDARLDSIEGKLDADSRKNLVAEKMSFEGSLIRRRWNWRRRII